MEVVRQIYDHPDDEVAIEWTDDVVHDLRRRPDATKCNQRRGQLDGNPCALDVASPCSMARRPSRCETVSKWWRKAVREAGARPIRLHDARHTAATMALRAGVPVKVVSQRLGHADVGVTLRVHQHVTPQDDRAAADALGRALDEIVSTS